MKEEIEKKSSRVFGEKVREDRLYPTVSLPRRKRILLGATYSSIEPLGLLYLAGLARDMGWDAHIRLIRNHDFSEFHDTVKDLKPQVVGFTLYTGNHAPLYSYFSRLRREKPGIKTVIGGPHATYFPDMSREFADYVVVSEGFNALSRILNDEVEPGIVYPRMLTPFPLPDRAQFYKDYPAHRRNPIKNVVSMTGCPFACTYCYNSSSIERVMGSRLSMEEIEGLKRVLGLSGRLFPMNMRACDSVLQEINDVMKLAPETQLFYWQDDTLGVARHMKFIKEFEKRYKLGVPFHGQTRFEMVNPATRRGIELVESLRRIGFNGLTIAIEAAHPVIRKEVLNRAMPDELIFSSLKKLSEMQFRVRTEQITGLPYGATSVLTPINLDADLGILKLNMNLRRETGLPNVAWATTLLPYLGTRMSDYCVKYGFVTEEDAENPVNGYHERSILRHLKEYMGHSLLEKKDSKNTWLSDEAQERYYKQNTHLRYNFGVMSYLSDLPDAERFVEKYLYDTEYFSVGSLNKAIRDHVSRHKSPAGCRIWQSIREFDRRIPEITHDETDRNRLRDIGAYCAVLPGDGAELARRYLHYSDGTDEVPLLSDIIKKYLFDTQLYMTDECTCELYGGTVWLEAKKEER